MRTATQIWAGAPLALPCTPFDNWLPGCYKGNINKVREAISCSSEQLRSHFTTTILVVQELTFLSQSSLPRTWIPPFITASVRHGVKTISAHPKPGLKSALYTTALVSIEKVKFKRRKPSATQTARTNTNADTFLYAGCKWLSSICWVWRSTQARACVCLLVGEGGIGIGIENPAIDWP